MPKFQHIRDICARVILAGDKEQFQAAVTELKIAMGRRATEELLTIPTGRVTEEPRDCPKT